MQTRILTTLVADNYEEIYIAKLKEIMTEPNLELIQDTFILTDPRNNVVHNKARKFNQKFTQAYAEWIAAGETDVSLLHSLNDNAKRFDSEYKGRFASYGPRFVAQLDHVIAELKHNPESRRACMMILDERDQILAEGLRIGETKCEYPCTMGLTFFIRDGKLHLQGHMRSNNYVLTVCIDVYLFTTFQRQVAEVLMLPVGNYYHSAVSAHVFAHEVPLVHSILKSDETAAFEARNLLGK